MGSTQEFAESLEATGTLSYTHPLADRRASTRQKQMFVSEMTPWAPGHPSIPFEVILEDTSDNGARVIGERPAKIGMRHLLMVPRTEGEKPIIREYNVARCDLRADGKYSIGLELIAGITVETEPMPEAMSEAMPRRGKGSQLKLIMLAFALVFLLIAMFIPL
jgi:hypothetical protein